MIPVAPQSPPDNFEQTVRIPGQNFLARFPNPTKNQKKRGSKIWARALPQLYKRYGRTCAYLAEWISRKDRSIDHFIPRSEGTSQAYEWSNFRLCLKQVNQFKSSFSVIDPFEVQHDWFVIDFDSYLIRPNRELSVELQGRIEDTITNLQLNNIIFRTRRTNWIDALYRGSTGLDGLRKRAPFIVYELERQDLVEEIKIKHHRFLERTGRI